MNNTIIEIGFDKNGEADFSISATIANLSLDQMNDLRKMIVVGIGTAEDMFRRSNEERRPKPIENLEIYRTDIPPGKYH